MRPPKNRVIENLYTRGDELLTERTYRNYVGYYHSVSGKNYVGAKYSPNAIKLVPYTEQQLVAAYNLSNIDPAYLRANPNIIDVVKKDAFPIVRVNFTPQDKEFQRYFIKRINQLNAPILEVDKQTYLNARDTKFYYTLSMIWNSPNSVIDYTTLEDQMPGIDTFLRNYSIPPGGDTAGF